MTGSTAVPDDRIVSLIDERPEEVNDMQRTVKGEVNVVDAVDFLRDKISRVDSNDEFVESMSA